MESFKLKLIKASGTIFEGDVLSAKLKTISGEIQILNNHADCVGILDNSQIEIVEPNNSKQVFEIAGGVCSVSEKILTIVAD